MDERVRMERRKELRQRDRRKTERKCGRERKEGREKRSERRWSNRWIGYKEERGGEKVRRPEEAERGQVIGQVTLSSAAMCRSKQKNQGGGRCV